MITLSDSELRELRIHRMLERRLAGERVGWEETLAADATHDIDWNAVVSLRSKGLLRRSRLAGNEAFLTDAGRQALGEL